jgi:hypothetical protein
MRIDILGSPHALNAPRVPALELRSGPLQPRRRTMVTVGLILTMASCACQRVGRAKPEPGEQDAGPDGGEAQAYQMERFGSGQGGGVMKLLPLKEGVLALTERPMYPYMVGERALLAFDPAGTLLFQYARRPDENVLDFAVHASGEVTVVTASLERFFLLRLSGDGHEVSRQELQDPEVTSDPYYPAGTEPEPVAGGLQPITPSDPLPPEARLAKVGESVVVALRTQRRSVLAYRHEWRAGEGFTPAWRTLLVPPHRGGQLQAPNSATYDTFGQMLLGHEIHLDADADGRVYLAIAVAQDLSAIQRRTWAQVAAHYSLLGEEVPQRPRQLADVLPELLTSATLLIALSERGEHRYSRVQSFERAHELYGMRRLDDKLFFLGRTFAETQGRTEFDAFVAAVDAASGETLFARAIDLEQGDIFYDIAQAGSMLLAVGATDWTQNLTGFSVSDDSEKLAATLHPDTGSLHCRLPLPAGPRHNELRSVIVNPRRPGSLYMGGAENGPASHTPVDELYSDLYLVRASGEPSCKGVVASGTVPYK